MPYMDDHLQGAQAPTIMQSSDPPIPDTDWIMVNTSSWGNLSAFYVAAQERADRLGGPCFSVSYPTFMVPFSRANRSTAYRAYHLRHDYQHEIDDALAYLVGSQPDGLFGGAYWLGVWELWREWLEPLWSLLDGIQQDTIDEYRAEQIAMHGYDLSLQRRRHYDIWMAPIRYGQEAYDALLSDIAGGRAPGYSRTHVTHHMASAMQYLMHGNGKWAYEWWGRGLDVSKTYWDRLVGGSDSGGRRLDVCAAEIALRLLAYPQQYWYEAKTLFDNNMVLFRLLDEIAESGESSARIGYRIVSAWNSAKEYNNRLFNMLCIVTKNKIKNVKKSVDI